MFESSPQLFKANELINVGKKQISTKKITRIIEDTIKNT